MKELEFLKRLLLDFESNAAQEAGELWTNSDAYTLLKDRIQYLMDTEKVNVGGTYKYYFHTYWFDPEGYYVKQSYIDIDVVANNVDEARTKVFEALKGSDGGFHTPRLAATLLRAEEI